MKRICCFLLVITTLLGVTGCGAEQGFTSDEACVWDGATPTKGFKTSKGEVCYVCEDCSSRCMLCGNDATDHYTNGLEIEVFVCEKCYEEIKDLFN